MSAGTEVKNWYDAAGELMERLGLPPNWSDRAIVAAALERGVVVSKDEQRDRILLTLNGRSHWWRDGLSSLNTRLVMRAAKNKDVLCAVLGARGAPMLWNQVFKSAEAQRAWNWGRRFDSVVVKPADATGGKLVFVNVTDKEQFMRAFQAVANDTGRVLVEEYMAGAEYRFLVVRRQVIAVAKREPAHIIGDGRRTVARLVAQKNRHRLRAPSHKHLKLGDSERALLASNGFSERTVPRRGEVVFLRSTSNLHTGGDAIDVTETIKPEHIRMVEQAARGLYGGALLGFDVIIPHGGEAEAGIIEVNTGPMISMHHLPWEGTPRNVAGAIMEAMFSELRHHRDVSYWAESIDSSAQGCKDAQIPILNLNIRQRISRFLKKMNG